MGTSIKTISLSDFDKILSMTTLSEMSGVYIIRDIVVEDREILDDKTMEVRTFATFDVDDAETGEWLGTVSTQGVVARQLERMRAHGLPKDARVGPVRVVKGGQNGRSLYFGEAK